MPPSSDNFSDPRRYAEFLERDNTSLRHQLDRCFSLERKLRWEADELQTRLRRQDWTNEQRADAFGRSPIGQPLSDRMQLQDDQVDLSQIKQLLEFDSSADARLHAIQQQSDAAQAEVRALTRELFDLEAKGGMPIGDALSIQRHLREEGEQLPKQLQRERDDALRKVSEQEAKIREQDLRVEQLTAALSQSDARQVAIVEGRKQDQVDLQRARADHRNILKQLSQLHLELKQERAATKLWQGRCQELTLEKDRQPGIIENRGKPGLEDFGHEMPEISDALFACLHD